MAVAIADLKADTGELYDNLNDGTTAAKSLLIKATSKITDITGTTTGFSLAIRNVADAYICQQQLGNLDPVSKSIAGSINVGEKRVVEMRDGFVNDATESLRVKGYNFKNNKPYIVQVND